MGKVSIDIETRSKVNLKKSGVYIYAADPSTSVLCLAWKQDDGITMAQDFSKPLSMEFHQLLDALKAGVVVSAFNASFERTIWNRCPHFRQFCDGVTLPETQVRCTMAKVLMIGLPQSLEQAAKALGSKVQKDLEGGKLMQKMCKPDKNGDWVDTPEQRDRLVQYCKIDVDTEYSIAQLTPEIPPDEQRLWELTERINDVGIFADIKTTTLAKSLMEQYAAEVDRECRELTGASGRQVKAVKEALVGMGLSLDSLNKKSVSDAMKGELDPVARRVLELRQESSKASTAKLGRILDMAGHDGRIRGNLIWHGTSTGRFAGRGVQVQNLPRPVIEDTDTIIECIQQGDLEYMKMMYSSPAEAVSSALRSLLMSWNGYLSWADFSAIECRMLSYLAGDKKTLDMFRNKIDPYKIMAAKIYHVPVLSVTKDQRGLGKVSVLSCGYQIGGKGFKAACEGYNIEIKESEAKRIVEIYRANNPEIVEMWADMESMCCDAVMNPGRVFKSHGMGAKVMDSFLRIRLISGRKLYFYKPYMKEKKTPWGDMKDVIHYTGTYLNRPSTETLYGGSITAMVTQATARDIMTQAMTRLDQAGMNIILSVHDEVVCEDFPARTEEIIKIMETTPAWAEGLPLKVEALERIRYGK